MTQGPLGARARLGTDALIPLLLGLGSTTWFAGWPAGLPPAVPWSALLLASIARIALGRPRRWARPHLETWLCLALALAYRAPALVHPWGWVTKDGAYGAFVALHLLQGHRPAPVFTEGANYQGTLKSHLAAALALVTGSRDLSWLMALSSALLSLVFLVASMNLARRIAGRGAALATGLYLALGPRFLTVFSLNCVGQYVDVLALGGVALALLARCLDTDSAQPSRVGSCFGAGLLLGAAFWQQPVALAYVLVAALALAANRASWRDRGTLAFPVGLALGALPVLLWNVQHGWASSGILGREPSELAAQAEVLPRLVARTLTVSFPVLAGLSARHPWGDWPLVRPMAVTLLPAAAIAYLALRGRTLGRALRVGRPTAALLPPLLTACCLALFWSVAAGAVLARPRYLLPLMAAAAVQLGVVAAWLWARSRVATVALAAGVLGLNVSGTWPRFAEGAELEAYYREIVRSLERLDIRTGYADFSLAAPVTMFTGERITLSARLGPTPAYYSELQEQRVRERGPDAFVLRPRDDSEAFAAALRRIGVGYRFQERPVPVFYALSRRPRLQEVLEARPAPAASPAGAEE